MGGGPKHLFQLIRGLQGCRPNWRFAVASPLDEPYGPRLQGVAQRHFTLPSGRFSLRALWHLARWLHTHPPDVVHSHGRGAGIYAHLLRSLQPSIPLVHTFHGVHRPPGRRGALKLALDKLLAPLTDRFICVSGQERDEVLRLGLGRAEQVALVCNGIDIDGVWHRCRQTSRTNMRQHWHIDADAFVLGTLARLDYQKGIDLLISALQRFQARYAEQKWICLIAGEGKERRSLEHILRQNGLSERVYLMGEIAEPTDLLAALDLYISFARWEGMPLSVLEAMACGLPCLLSDVVGHRDLIISGENGFLFALEDVDEFASRLAQLALSSDLCAQLGRAAHVYVRAHHGLDRWLTQTLQIYETLCSGHGEGHEP